MSRFSTPVAYAWRIGRWASPLLVAVLLLLVLVVAPLFSPASGATLSQQLEQKQAELNKAYAEFSAFQDELNELAAKYDAAESRMAMIEDKISVVENKIAVSEKDMAVVRAQLAQRVVDLYKDGYSSTPMYLEVLFAESDFVTVLQRFSLLSKLADQDQKLFDQVEAYLEKTREREAELEQKKLDQAAQIAELETLKTEMNDQLKASSAEYERLKGQVIRLREELRKAIEAAERAKEAAARAAAARAKAAARSSKSGGYVQSGSFVFPVNGSHSYTNSWGAPRSGGRTHKGTDIMAARGTPVVACVSGVISRANSKDTGLGGISIWLRGNNGNSYYYAHLDGLASGIYAGASVSAGQTIGYVGSTGNAGSVNHLHFEIHPGGGAAVNPYATLKAAD